MNDMTKRWNDMTERQKEFFGRLACETGYSGDTLVWAWDHISDWLDDIEGENMDVYGSELGFEITSEENCNGFVDDPYTYTAKEWIKEHFDDCAEYWEYEKFNFGSDAQTNPFDDPMKYKVLVFIAVVRDIVAGLPYIEEHWNDDITLTPDVIARLRYELCMTDDYPDEDNEVDNDEEEVE